MIRIFQFIAFIFFQTVLPAQQSTTSGQPFIDIVEVEAADTLAVDSVVRQRLNHWHENGYLNAALDSVIMNESAYNIYISTGEEFFYVPKKIEFVGHTVTGASPQNLITTQAVSFQEFNQLAYGLLSFYAQNGHPFARISREDVKVSENQVYLSLRISAGEPVFFDSISFTGEARLHSTFLENYLGIAYGAAYNEKRVKDAEKKLSELDFIRLTGPLQLRFQPALASITIEADNNDSNRFDGLAGISGGGEPEASLKINGLLNLYLSNAFGRGEFIDLSWQGPGNGTQILDLNGGFPYPFGFPLETEAMFSLHKQDSSWLQLELRPTLLFNLESKGKLGVFWHFTQNSLITSTMLQQDDRLPSLLDFKINLYGLEYRFYTAAYNNELLQKGSFIRMNVSAGTREIELNNNIPEVLYRGTEMKKFQLNLSSGMERRWKTSQRATISIGSQMAWISGKDLPQNQLFRLGGFHSLKGFDELSLMASAYVFTNIEFRFFTGPTSFFNLFANGGWYEQNISKAYYNDFPIGFGGGLNLQTPAGIFSINLALGWQKNSTLSSRNAKIHVGYISTF